MGLYRKTRVRVSTMSGDLLVWLYVLDAYEGGLPSASYLGLLAEAAEAADAPEDYVHRPSGQALPVHRPLTDSTRDRPSPHRAGGQRSRGRDRREDRRRRITTSPSCSARAGCPPPTRSARRPPRSPPPTSPASLPPAVAGHAGKIRSVRAGDRDVLVFLGRTHLYEGRGVRPGRARGPHRGGGGLPHRRAHQRLRRAEPSPGRRAPRAHQRPHQPDRHLAARGRDLRRPHRPLLRPAARAVPRRSTRPSTRGLRAAPRPALRDPAEIAHAAHDRGPTWSACRRRSRRSPPARPGWRSSASRWSPTSPPASPGEPLNHEEVLEAGRTAATRHGRPARRGRPGSGRAHAPTDRRRAAAPAPHGSRADAAGRPPETAQLARCDARRRRWPEHGPDEPTPGTPTTGPTSRPRDQPGRRGRSGAVAASPSACGTCAGCSLHATSTAPPPRVPGRAAGSAHWLGCDGRRRRSAPPAHSAHRAVGLLGRSGRRHARRGRGHHGGVVGQGRSAGRSGCSSTPIARLATCDLLAGTRRPVSAPSRASVDPAHQRLQVARRRRRAS